VSILLAALSTGCGKPHDYEIARVDSPIHARLTVSYGRRDITDAWLPGVGVVVGGMNAGLTCGNMTNDQLPRGHADGLLEADPAGGRVAARCRTGMTWEVFYFGTRTWFRTCDDLSQVFAHVQWQRVPDYEQGAIAAMMCMLDQFRRPTFATAAATIEEHEGPHGLSHFLASVALRDFGYYTGDPRSVDPDFVDALGRLPPLERESVIDVFAGAEQDGTLPAAIAQRARLVRERFGAASTARPPTP
jgi:hypothetical protein